MYRICFLILISFLTLHSAFCENGNSQSDVLEENVNAKLNQYWDLHEAYLASSSDSSLFFIKKVKTLAELHKENVWLAAAYGAMADIYYDQGFLGEAVYNYLEAGKYFEKNGELRSLARINNSLGDIYALAGNYDLALSYFNKAKDIFLYEGSVDEKVMAYRNIAVCYREMQMFDESKDALGAGMQLASRNNNNVLIRSLHNLMGALAFKRKEYALAREHYELAGYCNDSTRLCIEANAIAFNNIGEAYLYEHEFDLAEDWLLKALKAKKEINKSILTQSTLNLLAQLYIEKEEYDKAILLLEEGLSNVDLTIIDSEVDRGLSLIIEALVKASALGNSSKHAYLNQRFATYSQKLVAYNSHLLTQREELETIGKQQVVRLAVEKHSMNTKLGAAEEKNEKFKYAIIIPVFLLICAIVSVYLSLRRNARYKKLYAGIEEVLGNRALRKPNSK